MEGPKDPIKRSPHVRRPGLVIGLVLAGALVAGATLFARLRLGPGGPCEYKTPMCSEGRVCALLVEGQGRCLGLEDERTPMTPPFDPGATFACRQGPRPAKGSHAFGTDVFAVDLMPSPDVAEVTVRAPVAGEVTVFDGCDERDASANAKHTSRCGLGYGNQVKIWDGTNLVLLGHLAKVSVKDGTRVAKGDPLGIAGVSGDAGARHVHLVATRPGPNDDLAAIRRTAGWKGMTAVRASLDLPGGPVAFDALPCGPDAPFLTTP